MVWELDLVREIGGVVDQVRLKGGVNDSWEWKLEASGVYSVKSSYKAIMDIHQVQADVFLGKVWDYFVPLKVSALVWKLAQNRLPSKKKYSLQRNFTKFFVEM